LIRIRAWHRSATFAITGWIRDLYPPVLIMSVWLIASILEIQMKLRK
jgi:hypothetical protein